MILNLSPERVFGISDEERLQLYKLVEIYESHLWPNYEKNRYYEGKISLGEVNLGIALPQGMRGLEIGCAWGAKTVDVLAARSMFDGYVGEDGNENEELNAIVDANDLLTEYCKAARDELKLGCTFATLSKDGDSCRIRFHAPTEAAAEWDGARGRIKAGFAVLDTYRKHDMAHASVIGYYTDEAVIVMVKDGDDWRAEHFYHKMGRPLMEPLVWNATTEKPFGRSRIKEPIRNLIKGYVRTVANASIGLEFATAPQKYLLGVTDEQYDALISDKFKQYAGSMLVGTTNPDTGEKPTFGQLQQGNISPHVEMIRVLATQFSAATGLTVTDTGVVNDANPTSSDAILAQSQTLVAMAQELNAVNASHLKTIALMALAIARSTEDNDLNIDDLPDSDKAIVAHFKNPAMPSVAVTADAAIKIASARSEFAQTDTFLEMIGFDQADIRRIKAQEQRARGLALADEIV